MQHIGLRSRLKPNCVEAYVNAHRDIWPEVVETMKDAGIRQYLIFRDGLDLFHAIECVDWEAASEALSISPINQRWRATMAEFKDAQVDLSAGDGQLQLVYRFGEQ